MTKKDAIIYLISKAISQDAESSRFGFIHDKLFFELSNEDGDYGSIGEHYRVVYHNMHNQERVALVRVDAVKSLITPPVILNP